MTETDIRMQRPVTRWCPTCAATTRQRPPLWGQTGSPFGHTTCLECGTQLFRCYACRTYSVPGVDTHAQGPGCHCPRLEISAAAARFVASVPRLVAAGR